MVNGIKSLFVDGCMQCWYMYIVHISVFDTVNNQTTTHTQKKKRKTCGLVSMHFSKRTRPNGWNEFLIYELSETCVKTMKTTFQKCKATKQTQKNINRKQWKNINFSLIEWAAALHSSQPHFVLHGLWLWLSLSPALCGLEFCWVNLKMRPYISNMLYNKQSESDRCASFCNNRNQTNVKERGTNLI